MAKGTFFLLDDPDLMELVFQELGRHMVFHGGPKAMVDQGDRTLDSMAIYLYGHPGVSDEQPIMFELRFTEGEGGEIKGRVAGRILKISPLDVELFIEDTEQTLTRTRDETLR
jgi:hypothetical protein